MATFRSFLKVLKPARKGTIGHREPVEKKGGSLRREAYFIVSIIAASWIE